MVRPEKGAVDRQPVKDVGICSLAGRIEEEIYLGNDITYTITIGERQQVVIRSQNSDRSDLQSFRRGEKVYANWKARNIRIFNDTIKEVTPQAVK